MINRLFIKQNMIGEINLFPGLCYILLTALHPSFIGISSLLLANTTLLIALAYLFDVLKKDNQEETRFMAGWWLAVSGLIYSPYFVLLLLRTHFDEYAEDTESERYVPIYDRISMSFSNWVDDPCCCHRRPEPHYAGYVRFVWIAPDRSIIPFVGYHHPVRLWDF